MFINPPDTLQHGYCDGEGCSINGKAHPVLSDFLTI